MKKIFLIVALLFTTPIIHAESLLETYTARLGTDDHYNSKGKRLRSVAAIIRQDRANFHKFGIRDFEDQGDRFFASKGKRARLESMLNRGSMSRETRNAIVNGTPLITVNIYTDYIEVYLQ
ncbi:MAG: hypothetical protein GQ569_02760 [Methylococcaceae bacterium]|nr:hypothetical protein [Methylococcaceae bacterium]